jgi:hypothetical protein
VAENPYELKNFGLLAGLGAEPRGSSLLDYVTAPTLRPEVSPMARAIADLLTDRPKPALPVSPFLGAANDLFSPPKPASSPYSFGNLGAVADLFPPTKPALPVGPYPYSEAIADFFGPPKTAAMNALSGAVADLFPTAPPSRPFGFGSLADIVAAPAPSSFDALYTPPPKPKPVAPETKLQGVFLVSLRGCIPY